MSSRAARHTRRSQTTEKDDIESSQREVSVSASHNAAVTGTNEDEGGEEVRDFDDDDGGEGGGNGGEQSRSSDSASTQSGGTIPSHVRLGNGGARSGTSGTSDDVSTFSSGMDTRDFHLKHDFEALRGKLVNLDPATKKSLEEALDGLLGEVKDLKRKEESMEERLAILTKGYREKCGKGKRKFQREVRGLDLVNVDKVRNCLNHRVPDMILRENWAVYSERDNTFCQKFIQYAGVSVTNGFRDWKDYWCNFLAPLINYQLSNKRNNLVQKIRLQWYSELMRALYNKNLHHVSHNVNQLDC